MVWFIALILIVSLVFFERYLNRSPNKENTDVKSSNSSINYNKIINAGKSIKSAVIFMIVLISVSILFLLISLNVRHDNDFRVVIVLFSLCIIGANVLVVVNLYKAGQNLEDSIEK